MKKRTGIIIGAIAAVGLIGIALLPSDEPSPTQSAPSGETSTPEPEGVGRGKNLTLAAYNQIEAGMTYSEVVAIAGFEGDSMSVVEIEGIPKTEVFMWQNTLGSNMNVTFQDGVMVSKAQFGLK